VPCSASRVVPGAHRVVGPGTHRGSGPREVHMTVLLHTFFFSQTPSCKQHIQMCAGGDLMAKTLTEAAKLLQKD
jgi:hypothetical protein